MSSPSDAPRLRVFLAFIGMGLAVLSALDRASAAPPTGISLDQSTILENAPVGSLVGNLTAVDEDVTDSHTFQFASGNGDFHNGSFYLVGNQLRSTYGSVSERGTFFDFEGGGFTFLFRLKVTDSTGASYEQEFSFPLGDDRSEDADGDGFSELIEETIHGTSDVQIDSDGDGFSDWIEVLGGSLPTNAEDWPDYPLVGWGSNEAGELKAPDDADFSVVSTGHNHSLGLKPNGTVSGWAGFNLYGQITVPSGLNDVVSVAAGGNYWLLDSAHSLALHRDGSVTAWGRNEEGQTEVPAGLDDVVAVAAGRAHSLALKADGTVVAWGANLHGQSTVPSGLSGVVDIVAGGFYSLALKSDGTVVAWGKYFDGVEWQSESDFDDGAWKNAAAPAGLSDVVGVSAGIFHAMALKADGTVVCWGSNNDGQCAVPSGLGNVVSVAGGGFHSLALKENGEVIAWGSNKKGQTTVPAGALGEVRVISAGLQHSIALRESAGEPAITSSPRIVGVPGGPVSHQVVVGNPPVGPLVYQAIGLPAGLLLEPQTGLISGTVTAGAARTTFQVIVDTGGVQLRQTLWLSLATGGAPTAIQLTPPEIAENAPVTLTTFALAADDPDAGDTHSFELVEGEGSADNHYFRVEGTQLILNESIPRDFETTQQPLSIRLRAKDASLNPYEAIVNLQFTDDLTEDADGDGLTEADEAVEGTSDTVEDSDGDGFGDGFEVTHGTLPLDNLVFPGNTILVAWGDNSHGQSDHQTGLGEVVSVSSGWRHNLALRSDGTVAAWGWNADGQTTIPPGLTGVTAVSAGDYHSLALLADGSVVAWGGNADGQTAVPVDLTSPASDVVAISAGSYHSVALNRDGTVVAWGDDEFEQTAVPPGLDDVVAISAGGYHTLALKSDGTVVAWGRDWLGAATVPPGLSDVVGIAAGGLHSVALLRSGMVVAWGGNEDEQATVPHGLTGVKAIRAGWKHSLALGNDGTLSSWGSNLYGQTSLPLEANEVRDIAAGGFYNLVVRRASGFPEIPQGNLIAGWPGQSVAHPVGVNGATAAGFSAMGLPDGLTIDSQTGIIGGTVGTGEARTARIMAETDKGVLTRLMWLDTSRGSPPTGITLTPASGIGTLMENSPPETLIGMLAAADPDANDSHHFFARVLSGSYQTYCLTASGSSLVVQSSEGIDYEAGGDLTVLVRATDLGENFIEQTFVIHLVDDRTEDADGDGVTEAMEEDFFFTSDLVFDNFSTADADQDGVPSLIEFAFNLDLQAPDAGNLLGGEGSISGLPIGRMIVDPLGHKRLRLEFLRRKNSGLTYVPEFSSSPGTDGWQPAVHPLEITPVGDDWERCASEDHEFTPSPPLRFGRIRVSR